MACWIGVSLSRYPCAMTAEVEPPRSPRGARGALTVLAVFVGLTVVLVAARAGEVGLWDWDTYARMHFIHHYEPHIWVDGHILYTGVMRVLMALGLGDAAAIVVLSAASAAGFVCLLWWICRREGLAPVPTALVLAGGTIGSPGLVELFLMAEDNLLYLPVVLGMCWLLYLRHGERRDAIRRGIGIGALVAAAILINVSLLVILGLFAAAPIMAVRDRTRALGLGVALAAAVATYYLAHVVPFGGAKIALHEFLPQALGLKDFSHSTTPLLSLARFEQYRGGLRAIGVAPSIHLMSAPPWLTTLMLGVIPKLVVVLWAAVGVWLVRWRREELRAAFTTRLDLLALIAVGAAFPFFYEPYMIERWDLFWVGAVFGLVPLFKLRPSRVVVALVAAAIALQGVGTVVTVLHHHGVAWPTPGLVEARATARLVRERYPGVVVMDLGRDRLLLAEFRRRSGTRRVVLVGERDGAVTCIRMVDLIEVPSDLAEVQRALAEAQGPSYFDPELSPRVREALTPAAPR